jgi:hypothetical protein
MGFFKNRNTIVGVTDEERRDHFKPPKHVPVKGKNTSKTSKTSKTKKQPGKNG